MSKKLYDVLGVSDDASHNDIRTAYRKLAKKLHPDLNPGNKNAEDEFKEVSSAFSILGDEKKKSFMTPEKLMRQVRRRRSRNIIANMPTQMLTTIITRPLDMTISQIWVICSRKHSRDAVELNTAPTTRPCRFRVRTPGIT